MHPLLAEVLDVAESARQELLALLVPLEPERWAERAPAGGWSVAEVVGHLHLVEDSTVRVLFRTFRDARTNGLGSEAEHESRLGSLDAAGLEEARIPVAAPSFVTPTGAEEREVLLERLRHTRNGLRLWAGEADGFALSQLRVPHRVLGELDLYQWVLFLGQHERRHIRQISRILSAA